MTRDAGKLAQQQFRAASGMLACVVMAAAAIWFAVSLLSHDKHFQRDAIATTAVVDRTSYRWRLTGLDEHLVYYSFKSDDGRTWTGQSDMWRGEWEAARASGRVTVYYAHSNPKQSTTNLRSGRTAGMISLALGTLFVYCGLVYLRAVP